MGVATCSCVQSEAEPSATEPKVTLVYSEQRLSSGSKDGKNDGGKVQRERSKSKQKSFEVVKPTGEVKNVPSPFDVKEPCPKPGKSKSDISDQPYKQLKGQPEETDQRVPESDKNRPAVAPVAVIANAATGDPGADVPGAPTPDEDPPLPPPPEPPPSQDSLGNVKVDGKEGTESQTNQPVSHTIVDKEQKGVKDLKSLKQ